MNAESSRSHAIFVIQIAQKIDIRTPSLEPPLTTGKSDLRSSSKGKLTLGKRNGKKTESGAGSALMTSSQVIERKSKICLIDLAVIQYTAAPTPTPAVHTYIIVVYLAHGDSPSPWLLSVLI